MYIAYIDGNVKYYLPVYICWWFYYCFCAVQISATSLGLAVLIMIIMIFYVQFRFDQINEKLKLIEKKIEN